MKKLQPELDKPFAMHVEIDFEGVSESDGETYTVTPAMVYDQLGYVFEKLQHKHVKITFKIEMNPKIVEVKEEK